MKKFLICLLILLVCLLLTKSLLVDSIQIDYLYSFYIILLGICAIICVLTYKPHKVIVFSFETNNKTYLFKFANALDFSNHLQDFYKQAKKIYGEFDYYIQYMEKEETSFIPPWRIIFMIDNNQNNTNG